MSTYSRRSLTFIYTAGTVRPSDAFPSTFAVVYSPHACIQNSIQKSRKNCIQHESARKCVMMSRYDDDSGRMGPAHTFESYANISSKLPPRTQRPLSNQTTRQMSRAEYLVPYRNALRPQIIHPTSTLGGHVPRRESPGFEVRNPYEVPRLRHSGRTLGQLSASASPDPGLTCCLAPTA